VLTSVRGSLSALQNLNQRHSLANSPNSTCNANIFSASKSCPCNTCSSTILLSSCSCMENNFDKFIWHHSHSKYHRLIPTSHSLCLFHGCSCVPVLLRSRPRHIHKSLFNLLECLNSC